MGKKAAKPHAVLINLAVTLNIQRLMSDSYNIMCLRSARSKVMFPFG